MTAGDRPGVTQVIGAGRVGSLSSWPIAGIEVNHAEA